MFHIKQIVPECYVDSRVVQILLNSPVGPNHDHGVGNVLNKLENKLVDLPALGIVDQDPGKGPRAESWQHYEKIDADNEIFGLQLYKHKNRTHYLLEIQPEIEAWILAATKGLDIKLEDFDLPEQMKDFNKITKSINISKNKLFTNFIFKLIELESKPIIRMREILVEISQIHPEPNRRV